MIVLINEINDVTWKISKNLLNEGYVVAINKKNPYNLPVFHSKGTGNSVPDILFFNPNYEEIVFGNINNSRNSTGHIIAGFIETKRGEELHKLYQGSSQITRYYIYWITGQSRFYFNDKELKYVDVFLLASGYSSQGMLYNGDDYYPPRCLSYLSDAYDMKMYPYTHGIYSSLRNEKKKEIKRTKDDKLIVKKPYVELGILISKVPKFGNYTTDEFWAWTRNRIRPLSIYKKGSTIKTRVKIKEINEDSIKVDNGENNSIWLPKFHLNSKISRQDVGTIKELEIPIWLYNKNKHFFGLT